VLLLTGLVVGTALALTSLAADAAVAGSAEEDRYLADIQVIRGTSSGISCPDGWTKKPTDLNKGAGGDFIYLCTRYTTDPAEEKITNFWVIFCLR
jgi:hypothetical protein